MNTKDDAALLRELEAARCAAMVDADFASLRKLLHEDLIHVHAKAQVDNYESYFSTGGFKVNYTRLECGDLAIRVYGHTAPHDGPPAPGGSAQVQWRTGADRIAGNAGVGAGGCDLAAGGFPDHAGLSGASEKPLQTSS